MGLRLATTVLSLCLVVAGQAGAAPREAHKLGVEAIAAGRWQDAERHFRDAIAERSEERPRRLINPEYLPHYFLGVALSELGRCREALEALNESDRQGQTAKTDHASDMTRRRTDCQNHLRQVRAVRQAVEQALTQTGEVSATLNRMSETPEMASRWNQGNPSFEARQGTAEQALSVVRARLETQGEVGELERLNEAKSLAESALAELQATRVDAQRRLGELNAAISAAQDQLEVVMQGARDLLASTSYLAPYPRRLGSRVAAVETRLREIEDSRSGTEPQKLAELAEELTQSMAALRRAARRPPQKLSQALEAYVQGRYEEALTLLDDDELSTNPRTRPYVCVIQAASHHGKWVLGGEQEDDPSKQLAAAVITVCLDSETSEEPASLPLGSKIFSPRFVDFHATLLEADLAAAEDDSSADELAAGSTGAEEGVQPKPASAGQPEADANGEAEVGLQEG